MKIHITTFQLNSFQVGMVATFYQPSESEIVELCKKYTSAEVLRVTVRKVEVATNAMAVLLYSERTETPIDFNTEPVMAGFVTNGEYHADAR